MTEEDIREAFKYNYIEASYDKEHPISTIDLYVPRIEIQIENGVEMQEEILLECCTEHYSQSDRDSKSAFGTNVIRTTTPVTFIEAKYN